MAEQNEAGPPTRLQALAIDPLAFALAGLRRQRKALEVLAFAA
jgi:hypothetical protein